MKFNERKKKPKEKRQVTEVKERNNKNPNHSVKSWYENLSSAAMVRATCVQMQPSQTYTHFGDTLFTPIIAERVFP